MKTSIFVLLIVSYIMHIKSHCQLVQIETTQSVSCIGLARGTTFKLVTFYNGIIMFYYKEMKDIATQWLFRMETDNICGVYDCHLLVWWPSQNCGYHGHMMYLSSYKVACSTRRGFIWRILIFKLSNILLHTPACMCWTNANKQVLSISFVHL